MHIFQNLKNAEASYKNEKILIENNKDFVSRNNKKMLLVWMELSGLLFFILSVSAIIVNQISSRFIVYFLIFCVSAFMWIVVRKSNRGGFILFCFYVFMEIAFFFSAYLSIYVNSFSLSASTLGLICLIPTTVIDRYKRVFLITFLNVVLLCLASWYFKEPDLAFDDTINFVSFSIAGFFVGMHIRSRILLLFEYQRISKLQSYQDFLTQLPNRRKLFEDISLSEKGKVETVVTSVIMVDIDFFKAYNDSYGHQQGDKCLQAISCCIKKFGEENNVSFYRYGGEEFIGLGYIHSYEEVGEICEKLRKSIEDLKIPFEKSATGFVSVSQGYSEISRNKAPGYAKLINMADSALYVSKNNGRNRATGFDEKISLIDGMDSNDFMNLSSRYSMRTRM